MNHPKSRRNFIKAIVAAPAVGALAILPMTINAAITKNQYASRFKFSLNLYSFNSLLRNAEVDLFDMLNFCAEYNFDAIDPTGYYFPGYPEVPTDEYLYDFKKKAFLLGLEISGTGVRNDFANPDPARRKEDVEMIKKWVETAAKLGVPNLRIFSGTSEYKGFSRGHAFEWMAKDIRECCEYSKKFGVMIVIQNHNDFLKTADDVDRLFELVNSEWLGLNLDIGSYRMKDPYREIEQNIKHAVTWQIKENVWVNGQETPTDFKKLFSLIKKAGYRGYLPLETLGEGDPFTKVPRLLKLVQEALSQIA